MSGSATDGADVALTDVVMSFGGRRVLDGISCAFPSGRISVILGGSGVGKTTILRLIGGLLEPRSGSIRVLGREVADLPERSRYEVRDELGMMFQNGALLDSLTVLDNVALPLREHTRLGNDEIEDRVRECLASVGLSDADELYPRQLSGGMTKRAALARAIITNPRVLLCDEPFSGLDPLSTRRIERLLMRINEERDITVIAVSHDVASTKRMASHVVLLFPRQTFAGSPAELSAHADARVQAFLDPESADLDDDEEPDVEALESNARGGKA